MYFFGNFWDKFFSLVSMATRVSNMFGKIQFVFFVGFWTSYAMFNATICFISVRSFC